MSDLDKLVNSPLVRAAVREIYNGALALVRGPDAPSEEARKRILLDDLERAATAAAADPEVGHAMADGALLIYVNDPDVDAAWKRVQKWYS